MSDERRLIGSMRAGPMDGRLYNDDTWVVTVAGESRPGLDELFTIQFGTGAEDGPSDGLPGARSIHAAASYFDGVAEIVPVPSEPGTVY